MKKSKQTVLALETATPVCSVVLHIGGETFEERGVGRAVHSEQLFQFVDQLLDSHQLNVDDLDAVLVSAGPGSYTGLRIAASGIKGLLYERNVPLFGLNTLSSYARAVVQGAESIDSNIHAVIDARRSHLYHGHFKWHKEDGLVICDEVSTRNLETISNLVKPGDHIIGTGIDRLENISPNIVIRNRDYISAKSLIDLYLESDIFGYPSSLIKKVDLLDFDPRYYTSNQVAQNGGR